MSIASRLRTSVAVTALPAAIPAAAHHGPVGHPDLYLAENLIEFEGEIMDIFWRNPHPRMRMRVTEADATEQLWELELNNSPIGLRARGIDVDDFVRIGDHVRVAGVIAKFDENALVVRTTHVNWPQFDPYGTPQSEQAEYLETFRFDPADETLHYSFTATDPVMFTQPITLTRQRRWTPGVEIVPFDCGATWDE